MKPVYVLNGPNLNLLGHRQPELYGRTTLADIHESLKTRAGPLGLRIEFRQSNHEGELIDWIHEARSDGSASSSIRPATPTARSRYSMRCSPAASGDRGAPDQYLQA